MFTTIVDKLWLRPIEPQQNRFIILLYYYIIVFLVFDALKFKKSHLKKWSRIKLKKKYNHIKTKRDLIIPEFYDSSHK